MIYAKIAPLLWALNFILMCYWFGWGLWKWVPSEFGLSLDIFYVTGTIYFGIFMPLYLSNVSLFWPHAKVRKFVWRKGRPWNDG